MQRVYIFGFNNDYYVVQDHVENGAPTMWSWRVYPGDVELPQGLITGRQLEAWVGSILAAGHTIRDVTARASGYAPGGVYVGELRPERCGQ